MEWTKSSHSNPSGNCVLVAVDGETVLVRDSRQPGGPVLCLGRGAWAAFIGGIKRGELAGPRP